MKSILKPTVSISPVRRHSPRAKSRGQSPKKSTPEKMQNDPRYDLPVRNNSKSLAESTSMLDHLDGSSGHISSKSGLVSPSQYRTRIVVRSEEEQQAAAKERERHELLAHKEARRKSLGETDRIYSRFGGASRNVDLANRTLADLGSKSKGLIRT